MFRDSLSNLKEITLIKFLEKWDFSDYDFSIEISSINNWKDFLVFLNLFLKYDCFDKNIIYLDKFISEFKEKKSEIIIYEAYVINRNEKLEDFLFKYNKKWIIKESFEFEWVVDLLKKSKEIIDEWKDVIIIYNSINSSLWFKDEKVYFDFLLELLLIDNNWYFRELNIIFTIFEYSLNKSLSEWVKKVAFYMDDYFENSFRNKKYIFSLSQRLIKKYCREDFSYKNTIIKNIMLFIWRKSFYKEFFEDNDNIKLKEFLFWVIIWTINNKSLTIEDIKKWIKTRLKEDSRLINKLITDYKNDISLTRDNYINYMIDSF